MIYTRRCGRRAPLLAAVLAALLGSVIGNAQEDLGGAKTLYVNASYDEALGILDKQAATIGPSGTRAAEVQHYRALCLIALGRTAEADQAITLSVAADPFSVPDTSELAPRVASVFTVARARIVPEVARATLADGRQLMQKGAAAAANQKFDAVIRLLSEPALAGRADLADLTLAVNALAELTRAQMAAAASAPSAAESPATPPAATAPVSPAASTPASRAAATPPRSAGAQPPRSAGAQPPPVQPPPAGQRVTLRPPAAAPAAVQAPPSADGTFVAPVPISQVLPRWQPENGAVRQLGFSGAVRVTIDTTGKVTSAVMDRPVYPPYDRQVLAAARTWTYRPATRNGQPVISDRVVEIVLRATN